MKKNFHKTLVLITAAIAVLILILMLSVPMGAQEKTFIHGEPTMEPIHTVVFEELKYSYCKTLMEYIYPELKGEKYIHIKEMQRTLIPVFFIPAPQFVAQTIICVSHLDLSQVFSSMKFSFSMSILSRGWMNFGSMLKYASVMGGINLSRFRT